MAGPRLWTRQPLRRLSVARLARGPLACSRPSSNLSAILTGLRRTAKAERSKNSPSWAVSSPQKTRSDGDRETPVWTPRSSSSDGGQDAATKAPEGTPSRRLERKRLRRELKASMEEDQEDGGKQTRRKRFLDPNSAYGKKSLVYHIRHGNLEDEANRLPFKRPAAQNWPSELPLNSGTLEEYQRLKDIPPNERAAELGREEPRFSSSFRLAPRRRDGLPLPKLPPKSIILKHRRRRQPEKRQPEERQPEERAGGFGADEDFLRRSFTPHNMEATERTWRDWGFDDEIQFTVPASQFLYGRNSVLAALRFGKRRVYKLYLYSGKNRRHSKEDEIILDLAKRREVPIVAVPEHKRGLLDKMSNNRAHNGVVLETSVLPQKPVISLGEVEESPGRLGYHVKLSHQSLEDERVNGTGTFIRRMEGIAPKPFVLLLHHVVDPGNLGALLRTAHFLGVDAVAITKTNSAGLSAVAIKASAGAAEEMTIFIVTSAIHFLEQSKMLGWKTYAAVAQPSKRRSPQRAADVLQPDDIERDDPLARHPCILVLGNEGQGITNNVKLMVDYQVTIPTWSPASSVDSLNVSVAGALLCQSFLKASAASVAKPAAAAIQTGKEAWPSALPVRPVESQAKRAASELLF